MRDDAVLRRALPLGRGLGPSLGQPHQEARYGTPLGRPRFRLLKQH